MPARMQLDDEAILRMYANGMSPTAIGKVFHCNRKTVEKRIQEHQNRPNAPRPNRLGRAGTLCWNCQHAVGKDQCSWAHHFQPVEGWDAVPTIIVDKDQRNIVQHVCRSYHVYDCPQFLRDKPRKERTYDWFSADDC